MRDARGGIRQVHAAARAIAADDPHTADGHIPGDGRVRDGDDRGEVILDGTVDPSALAHAAVAARPAIPARDPVAGDVAIADREGRGVEVDASAMSGASLAADTAGAARGRVVGDRAAGHGQGRAPLAEQTAALALPANGVGASGPAPDHAVGDGAVTERDGAVLALDRPAPGVATLAAVATRAGEDVVGGECGVGDREERRVIDADVADGSAEGATALPTIPGHTADGLVVAERAGRPRPVMVEPTLSRK